jgi:P22_AR N-terminal domain/Meiotically up-regulated gene 113
VADSHYVNSYEDRISTYKDEHTGKVYCIPREIATELGVSWSSQSLKLKGELYQQHTIRMHIKTAAGMREMTLLDVNLLPAWLLSIPVKKVRADVQEKLLAYHKGSSFDEAFPDLRERVTSVVPRPRAVQSVYAIRQEHTRTFKIGIAQDAQQRLRELQIGNPARLCLAHRWQVPDPAKIETLLHRQFAPYAVRGEWFTLSAIQEEALLALMASLGANHGGAQLMFDFIVA